jgi:8-oxo-dGTP diphosphatase
VTRVVPAAGGLVWRAGPGARASGASASQRGPEIVVVHRPRYDDWTLPKGKLDRGEHPLAAAVREVHEETGVHGAPQVRLPTVRYLTGVPDVEKMVDYWSMRLVADDGHEPDYEVDAVEWIPLSAAREVLTYAHDRGVAAAFAALPPVSGVVVLLRHAYAGERSQWDGPDDVRPLDEVGRRDAGYAAGLLALFRAERIISAPVLRCRQSVEPLAERIRVPVEVDGRFAEGGDVDEAAAALQALAAAEPAAVVCSQGELIRPLLARLRGNVTHELDTPKGAGWVLAYTADGKLVATDPLDPRSP